MEKSQRNKEKRQLKKSIETVIGFPMGCSASYKSETKTWKVNMYVDFDIPEGLEIVEEGSLEDAKKKEVLTFMDSKKKHIESLLLEQFNATPLYEKENEYNFTQTFPPMFSLKRDANGVRLKTPEEQEQEKVLHPELVDMIEHDMEVLSKGYFVYEGTKDYEHYEGFRLVKYAGLRARYTFIIPHKEEKVAS